MFSNLKKRLRSWVDSIATSAIQRKKRLEQAEKDRVAKEQMAVIMKAIEQTQNEPKDSFVPLTRSYSTFSGLDIRMYLSDSAEDFLVANGGKVYGNAQAVSWVINRNSSDEYDVTGTIIDLVLDEPTTPTGKYMTLVACNEFGKAAILIQVSDFEVILTASGVSIDDMVIEQQHTWRGKFVRSGKLGEWVDNDHR